MTVRFAWLYTLIAASTLQAQDPWSTYRGNAQRTGCTDGKAGPAKPDVLWVHKAQEHYIASPVPVGERLFVSSISGFNAPAISLFETSAQARQRVTWSKTVPVFKLPTVSSPALSGGKLVFGDGMHQTDGAVLYCVSADNGRALWQLTVPGELVHLEGSPTIAGGKVYLGGGAAGVICVDLNKVTLEGKEQTVDAIAKILDEKWAALLKKYEEEKKKDEFAVPPTEDQLPRPSPLRVWSQGDRKWHVDAPVAVVGDRVLAASAFLDKEKVGDRALYSLAAADGKIQWRTELPLNPWGGPAVKGDVVVVGGSTIGYEVTALKGAKGDIAAFELATGKLKWRKTVTAGILGAVAIAGDTVVATASDGKVRAFDLATGDRRWIYENKTPIFAPPAIAGDVVYAADLKGVVHAIGLSDGLGKWTLDLGAHPAVKSPGMVYGGPVVHGGRIYLATCNLAGDFVNRPTAVVCIGEK
jgi:outer membrane protein assembly factor BamB